MFTYIYIYIEICILYIYIYVERDMYTKIVNHSIIPNFRVVELSGIPPVKAHEFALTGHLGG